METASRKSWWDMYCIRNSRSRNRNIRSYFSRIDGVIIASSGNGGLYWICRKSNASKPEELVFLNESGRDRLGFLSVRIVSLLILCMQNLFLAFFAIETSFH